MYIPSFGFLSPISVLGIDLGILPGIILIRHMGSLLARMSWPNHQSIPPVPLHSVQLVCQGAGGDPGIGPGPATHMQKRGRMIVLKI